MKIIEGKIVAAAIEKHIKQAIEAKGGKRAPGLAFILAGDNSASRTYIRMKKRKCAEVGILSFDREFPATISEKEFLKTIDAFNQDSQIDGILIQLPLPSHISTFKAIEAVDPTKDVDGFHPLNFGKILLGEQDAFFPCTPQGVLMLLHHYNIQVAGQHVVIVGRSNIVGKPLAAMLMQKTAQANATVTVAHSNTRNLKEICRTADILIAALGVPQFIDNSFIKPGAVVIDVGINRQNGKIVGDVDFNSVADSASYLTPVPGGVGPMTIAMLLSNTLLSYQRRLYP